MGKRIDELQEVSTPSDSSLIITRDPVLTGDKTRKLTLTNLLAWINGKLSLGTSATKNMASGVSTFGTASGSDVTTSATDTTAGRVLKVGDFGLGASEVYRFKGDLDDLVGFTTSQISLISPITSSSSGATVSIGDWVQVNRWDRNAVFQTLYKRNTDSIARQYIRAKKAEAGPWTAWQELYHTGNYPSDTAWTTTTTLLNGWTGTINYIRRAGMVTINIEGVNGASSIGVGILDLPAEYRPSVPNIRFSLVDTDTPAGRGLINNGGSLAIIGTVGTVLRGSVTYPVIT